MGAGDVVRVLGGVLETGIPPFIHSDPEDPSILAEQ
jgi:hypothetical protein